MWFASLIDRFQPPSLPMKDQRRSRMLVGIVLACIGANVVGAGVNAIVTQDLIGMARTAAEPWC